MICPQCQRRYVHERCFYCNPVDPLNLGAEPAAIKGYDFLSSTTGRWLILDGPAGSPVWRGDDLSTAAAILRDSGNRLIDLFGEASL